MTLIFTSQHKKFIINIVYLIYALLICLFCLVSIMHATTHKSNKSANGRGVKPKWRKSIATTTPDSILLTTIAKNGITNFNSNNKTTSFYSIINSLFSNFNDMSTSNLTTINQNIYGVTNNEVDYIGYSQFRNNTYSTNIYQTLPSFPAAFDFEVPVDSDNKNGNNYWALGLLFFPILTIFGNILVVLAVVREKSLHTVTNYFVVSLAIADLTVASLVMPFAVYYEVTKTWRMSTILCDAWVATDVMGSTASILNLVAIAIDRFIAVTRPLKYAQHKNSNRIYYTIAFVWLISIAIASPIAIGFNDTPDRQANQCAFNNEKFLIYSSIFSFYIPTIVMIILYYRIFRVIRMRAKKTKKKTDKKALPIESPGPNRQEKINLISEGIFKLKNTEQLTPVTTSKIKINELNTAKTITTTNSNINEIVKETNLDEEKNANQTKTTSNTVPLLIENKSKPSAKAPLATTANADKASNKKTKTTTIQKFQTPPMTSSNKERKVTKTLAIVLIVFLVCWSPFFAINNLMKGICKQFEIKCDFIKEEVISFLSWLGYVNSLLNPCIYTIFNIEFRKAFAKILADFCLFKKKN